MPTVSTQGTEQLKLYKNNKLYNGSRYQFYLTNREQAFQTFLGTPAFTKTVSYKSISEPILLNEYIKDCDELTYGSITNEDKIYYFFVDSITTDAYKQTTITFTIDWWTTNWSKIDCTKAHITRQNLSKPGYMEQPVSTKNMSITHSSITNNFVIMATYIPSGDGVDISFISYVILKGNIINTSLVEQGYWYQKLGISGADIKDCFVVPFYDYTDFATTNKVISVNLSNYTGTLLEKVANAVSDVFGAPTQGTEAAEFIAWLHSTFGNPVPVYDASSAKLYGWYSDLQHTPPNYVEEIDYPFTTNLAEYITKGHKVANTTNYTFDESYKMYSMKDGQTRALSKNLTGQTFSSTELSRELIVDWNGNQIWECPVGYSNISFETRLLMGLSHIMLEFVPTSDKDNSNMLIGKSFCYDCRHPGLFVDSYQDYILKNRDYDIEMRRIQSEKQEVQSWSSVAENIGFGMAFGKKQGAAAAGIGGVIEATSTTLINQLYDPQIQEQYDLRYQRMTDQISVVGDSITNIYNVLSTSSGMLKKCVISVSTSAQTRYNNDINTNGYYSDEVTSTLSTTYFATGRVIQADNVVVEGACNVIGKQQVVRRLQNGVEFI